jgi:hypothetical protein
MAGFSWDGQNITFGINQAMAKVRELQKAKKTSLFVVAGVIALGIILFIRKK